MSAYASLLISAVLVGTGLSAEAGTPVTLTGYGWTVAVDGEQGVLTASHDRLGAVLENVRLNLRGEHGLVAWRTFSAERKGDRRLVLRTAAPATVWLVETTPEALRVSSTSTRAVLTAEAPAAPDRIVARLLDPTGTPVDWVGTNEVAGGYGGSETRNPSFLPARNPDVMYFALGPVAGSTFHSLFDRKTDTAIRFPEDTLIARDPQDANRLDVTIPVPGNAV